MASRSILPAVWDVPAALRGRLGAKAGRQRAMFADGHLLLVLHAPPAEEDDERQPRFFWRHADGTWTGSEGGSGIGVLVRHVDQFHERLEQLDRMEEAASDAEDYFEVLADLAPLQRATRNLYETLQEARKRVPDDHELIDVRDRAYDLARRGELLGSHAKNALDYQIAKGAERQAKSSHQMAVSAHRLNVLAAFFFPIVTISAVFGVNLRHGLEDQSPWLFAAFIALGMCCGLLLKSFVAPSRPKQENEQ